MVTRYRPTQAGMQATLHPPEGVLEEDIDVLDSLIDATGGSALDIQQGVTLIDIGQAELRYTSGRERTSDAALRGSLQRLQRQDLVRARPIAVGARSS